MNIGDTISVVFGFCDCGSDYKSWMLVCRLWNCVSCKRFPRAKLIFGNRITNLIEDTDSMEIIRGCVSTRTLITNNQIIPQKWKTLNKFEHCEKKPCNFTYNEMIDLYEKHNRSFNSCLIFNKPFEKGEFLNFFFNIVNDIDDNSIDNGFIVGNYFEFHSSVSIEEIILASDYVRIVWHKIPLSHWDSLTDEYWKILEDRGVTPKYPTDIDQLPTTDNKMESWCKYPTTTPEMIYEINDMIVHSVRYQGYLCYHVDYFVIQNVNISYDQTVSILKKNMDNPGRFSNLWRAILK